MPWPWLGGVELRAGAGESVGAVEGDVELWAESMPLLGQTLWRSQWWKKKVS